jgi:TP901 family phage tail tape measure protein
MAEQRDLKILLKLQDEASSELRRVSGQLEQTNRVTSTLKNSVLGLAGAYLGMQGLRMALKGTIGAAVEWESAFAGIRKTVDATEAQFSALNKSIREMSKEIPLGTTELAKIGELAGQLGVNVKDIDGFVESVAKIGFTTNLTTEQAATSFARIANIMQEPITNIDRMASSVVDLGNNFATTESEIVEFANRIAGAGRIAGLSTSDIFAIGTAMSSVGVQAEAGGTAVQKVLIAMSDAAVGTGDNLEEFAKVTGKTTAEFSEAFKKDAAGTFRDFVEGLGRQGDNAIGTLDSIGLADQRLIRSFLSLANADMLMRDSLEMSSKAWEVNTALQEEAAKRVDTTSAQWQLLKNNFAAIGIVIGTALLPIANRLIDWLVQGIQWIGRLSGVIKEASGAIEAKTGLVTLLRSAWEAVVLVFTQRLLPAFQEFWETLQPYRPYLEALAKILGVVLVGVIVGLILTVAGLAIALIEIFSWFVKISDFLSGVFVTTLNFISAQTEKYIEVLNNLIDKLQTAWSWITKVTSSSGAIGGAISGGVSSVMSLLPGRAHGGPVRAGSPYIVGEQGPELFVPGTNGNINPRLAGAGGNVIVNVTVNGDVSGEELIRKVEEAFMSKLRTNTRFTA